MMHGPTNIKQPVFQKSVENLKIEAWSKICTSERHTHTHIKKYRVAG